MKKKLILTLLTAFVCATTAIETTSLAMENPIIDFESNTNKSEDEIKKDIQVAKGKISDYNNIVDFLSHSENLELKDQINLINFTYTQALEVLNSNLLSEVKNFDKNTHYAFTTINDFLEKFKKTVQNSASLTDLKNNVKEQTNIIRDSLKQIDKEQEKQKNNSIGSFTNNALFDIYSVDIEPAPLFHQNMPMSVPIGNLQQINDNIKDIKNDEMVDKPQFDNKNDKNINNNEMIEKEEQQQANKIEDKNKIEEQPKVNNIDNKNEIKEPEVNNIDNKNEIKDENEINKTYQNLLKETPIQNTINFVKDLLNSSIELAADSAMAFSETASSIGAIDYNAPNHNFKKKKVDNYCVDALVVFLNKIEEISKKTSKAKKELSIFKEDIKELEKNLNEAKSKISEIKSYMTSKKTKSADILNIKLMTSVKFINIYTLEYKIYTFIDTIIEKLLTAYTTYDAIPPKNEDVEQSMLNFKKFKANFLIFGQLRFGLYRNICSILNQFAKKEIREISSKDYINKLQELIPQILELYNEIKEKYSDEGILNEYILELIKLCKNYTESASSELKYMNGPKFKLDKIHKSAVNFMRKLELGLFKCKF